MRFYRDPFPTLESGEVLVKLNDLPGLIIAAIGALRLRPLQIFQLNEFVFVSGELSGGFQLRPDFPRHPLAFRVRRRDDQGRLAFADGRMREEIAMIAKTIETRDVNITNHAAKTDELCKITQAKCDETVASIELMLKNLGSQVDTKAIVKGIEDAMKNLFLPLHVRASDLAYTVGPTVDKLNAAADRAAKLWPQRIWKMALTAGVMVGLSIAALGIGAASWQMKSHFDKTLADEIRAEKYTLKNNQEAFQKLATADVPVYVARSSNPDGTLIPRGYCLYIPNAQGADFKDGTGRIFFTSPRPEAELKQLLDVQQQ